ncbi:MAG: glyoxalase [Okeania sp. SIO2H7]|nr:glyoxalase [Okeania sp. SIO2H7]
MNPILFHLAFPVTDIAKAKDFYGKGLGCDIGRESKNAVIMNMYGNQIVAHLSKDELLPQKGIYPRHFGLIFATESDWEEILEKAQKNNLQFYQEPKRRFGGSTLEHRTFFLEDPFHNLLEFKYYCHSEAIFGASEHSQVGDAVSH